jgi:two-component system OmpR family response regulator
VEELIVRARAILRRVHEIEEDSRTLRCADLVLDEDRHEVIRAGQPVELTPTEFKLLHYLLLNTERVVSKAQILDRVWQYDFDGNENVVEIFISSLRRKVEAHGPRLIQTVRGVGYRMRPPHASGPRRAAPDGP